MPQQALIPTTTQVTTTGSSISIFTFYDPGYYHLIACFIAEKIGVILGTPYIEGDFICTLRDSPNKITVQYDNNGNVIIFAPPGEEYSFDADGNLIVTVDIVD